jgi:hypothetical protein
MRSNARREAASAISHSAMFETVSSSTACAAATSATSSANTSAIVHRPLDCVAACTIVVFRDRSATSRRSPSSRSTGCSGPNRTVASPSSVDRVTVHSSMVGAPGSSASPKSSKAAASVRLHGSILLMLSNAIAEVSGSRACAVSSSLEDGVPDTSLVQPATNTQATTAASTAADLTDKSHS